MKLMEQSSTNISRLLDTTIGKVRDMINVDTVVGSPVTAPDGTTIIPVSRVSYAFASGGTDFRVADQTNMGFGGGNGAGVKIEPIGFLMVRDGNVRMINITPPAFTTVDRVIERVPEILDSVEQFIDKFRKNDSEN